MESDISVEHTDLTGPDRGLRRSVFGTDFDNLQRRMVRSFSIETCGLDVSGRFCHVLSVAGMAGTAANSVMGMECGPTGTLSYRHPATTPPVRHPHYGGVPLCLAKTVM